MIKERCDYVRIILQVLAVAGGVMGLMYLYIAVHFIFLVILEPKGSAGYRIVFSVMFLLFGIYLLFVCFIMLKRFSIKSINHFSVVLAFIFLGVAGSFVRSTIAPLMDKTNHGVKLLISLAPLILAFLIYKFLKILLVKLTGLK